jgi:hypothetical protein
MIDTSRTHLPIGAQTMNVKDTAAPRSIGTLANLAGCAYPDTEQGRAFLTGLESAAHEILEYADDDTPADRLDDEGYVHEAADSAVPVYTGARWQVFADLAAWNEDTEELGASGSDLTGAAGVALYMIARRGLDAILSEILDENSDDGA